MAIVDWRIAADSFGACNCDWGCPCQFNAPPTYGSCEGFGAFEIRKGHFGDTSLDGLRGIFIYYWPGPIHEGNGRFQPIIDERADGAQRDALWKIVSGHETEPGATHFQVFASTVSKSYEPLYSAIEFTLDIDARRASLRAEGHIEASGEPIRNPITGDEHRARIDLPMGFGYRIAEIGSGTFNITTAIPMAHEAQHADFARIDLTGSGPV